MLTTVLLIALTIALPVVVVAVAYRKMLKLDKIWEEQQKYHDQLWEDYRVYRGVTND